ncbi:MAG: hypothetical protein H6754_01620 [Candidatus Omnitrophica bacterium]|nr:hypothetical protein [Candidatus Omnitrophota bacterium]
MAANNYEAEKLLKDQRVIEEIQRHLWIESEKVGHDVGFETAKADWLKKFSKAWMAYNMPEAIVKERKSESAPKVKEAKAQAQTQALAGKEAQASAAAATSPKRRAKSYI